jgi:hypothetical protein
MQLEASTRMPANPEALAKLGAMLMSKFTEYENMRKIAEQKWLRNARQVLGIYDPDIESMIPRNRSRAYPKLTRVKCVSMLSRLMNLLFQVEEKNWTVSAPAVPDLSQEDLQAVLDALMQKTPDRVPNDDEIEAAIRRFAQKRAQRLETEIEDQLQELGGTKALNYVALCRKVLASGIQYGAGLLRGPFVVEQKMVKWKLVNQKLEAVPYTCMRPRFEFVPIWDYYPDMGAKTFEQMEGQFMRVVMNKHQLVKLKLRPDFLADQIDKFLATHPNGNYKRRSFESDLRSMGVQINSSVSETRKYELVVWEGYVSGIDLQACGARVPASKINEDVRATVWVADGMVVKADIDPWVTLTPDAEMPQYHHFIFEEDETFLLGNALPNIMRDSQMGVCAATRMTLDQASVQRVVEVNNALLRLDQDIQSIDPDMVIFRDDDNPATAQYPAVRVIKFDTGIAEMQAIIKQFQDFADSETFVNAASGGDVQNAPSEPFRTAAGASMLRGDAALPFKDVVRNFDVFTESVIGALLVFNRKFAYDDRLKGEFAAVARGATSLIAKEVLGQQIDNLAQTLTPEEKRYLKPLELLRARVRVRDMASSDIVMNDEEAQAADAAAQQAQEQQQQQQQQLLEANVRKILSDTLKNIAQAGKNSASAEATTANVILDALERGLNPDMLAVTNQGATNGNPTAAASEPANGGNGAGGPAASQPAGTGTRSLEAATGDAASRSGSFAAAMPAG